MKLTIKNVTNMIAYTDIPENKVKVPFTWKTDKYSWEQNELISHEISFNHSDSSTSITLKSYYTGDKHIDGLTFYGFLDKIISGVKLDTALKIDDSNQQVNTFIYKGETTNKYLIDILNKKIKSICM